jgi:PleD family two-component response regulator
LQRRWGETSYREGFFTIRCGIIGRNRGSEGAIMAIEKILVVDDEDIISSYLQRKLTKLGYTVYVAGDGESLGHGKRQF